MAKSVRRIHGSLCAPCLACQNVEAGGEHIPVSAGAQRVFSETKDTILSHFSRLGEPKHTPK